MNGSYCVVVGWNVAYMLPAGGKPTRLPEKFWQRQTLLYVTKRPQTLETYTNYEEATEHAKRLHAEFIMRKRRLR